MGADLSHLRRSPKAKTASGIGWRDGDYTESPIPRGWPAVPAQEKGIDVGLAVDFVKPAIVGKYHVGVMMSTDNDLLPALEVVRNPDPGRIQAAVAARSAPKHHQRLLILQCHWLDQADYNAVAYTAGH